MIALYWDKVLIKVPAEYFNYINIFSFELAMGLPKNTSINKYAHELIGEKQPPYRPIYAFSLVKFEILKTYIETYLKTRFI